MYLRFEPCSNLAPLYEMNVNLLAKLHADEVDTIMLDNFTTEPLREGYSASPAVHCRSHRRRHYLRWRAHSECQLPRSRALYSLLTLKRLEPHHKSFVQPYAIRP